MMKLALIFLLILFCSLKTTMAQQNLISEKVKIPPVIDGVATDNVWEQCEKVVVRDVVENIDLELKSVHTNDNIFFLVRYPDATESRTHKSLTWSKERKAYTSGKDREDIFVFKWNMEPFPVDLSISADEPYRADIWHWKAFRTDPVGYADDKIHIYSREITKNSTLRISKNNRDFFLSRLSDHGKSAYISATYQQRVDDIVPKYINRVPMGSRADVRAKGVWSDGFWNIEFGRYLQTNHPDDVQFNTKLNYLFGLSRHEIAGKKPDPSLEQPNYETGEVGEIIMLTFR